VTCFKSSTTSEVYYKCVISLLSILVTRGNEENISSSIDILTDIIVLLSSMLNSNRFNHLLVDCFFDHSKKSDLKQHTDQRHLYSEILKLIFNLIQGICTGTVEAAKSSYSLINALIVMMKSTQELTKQKPMNNVNVVDTFPIIMQLIRKFEYHSQLLEADTSVQQDFCEMVVNRIASTISSADEETFDNSNETSYLEVLAVFEFYNVGSSWSSVMNSEMHKRSVTFNKLVMYLYYNDLINVSTVSV